MPHGQAADHVRGIVDIIGLRGAAACAGVALGAIALVGCGGSSGGAKPTPTRAATTAAPATATATTATTLTSATAPTTTTQAPAPAGNGAADQQIARSAQLRLADFPAGWRESGTASGTLETPCQAVNGAKAATSARSKSRTFSEDPYVAQSAAYMYADKAGASHWFAQLGSSATRSCLGNAITKQLTKALKGKKLQIGATSTSSATVEPVGDERTAIRVAVPITQGSTTFDLTVAYVLVRVDRGLAIVALEGTGKPFDSALGGKLVLDVADRLQAGLK